jgi:hypothetical protein
MRGSRTWGGVVDAGADQVLARADAVGDDARPERRCALRGAQPDVQRRTPHPNPLPKREREFIECAEAPPLPFAAAFGGRAGVPSSLESARSGGLGR